MTRTPRILSWIVSRSSRGRVLASVRVISRVRGSVQGVGFRPYVYRLARGLGLNGWVCNTPDGVIIEAEGSDAEVALFTERLESEAPAQARVVSIERVFDIPAGVR